MSLAKNWSFTINNFTPDEFTSLTNLATNAAVRYIVFQHEEGAEGTSHLQGKRAG